MPLKKESWERFDVEGLFPSPTVHANTLIKIDEDEDVHGDDSISMNDIIPKHSDTLYEVESDNSFGDNTEIKVEADKTENRRQKEKNLDEKEDVSEEKPIQKEKEEIDEVAEATSKTSEDVHGGDEATKDIEDSPNAANDGQQEDNEGADKGKDGENGEGDAGKNGGEDGKGKSDEKSPSFTEEEGWEKTADSSVKKPYLASLEDFAKEAKIGDRSCSGNNYDWERENSPAILETVFKKGSELIRKFANEEDVSNKVFGTQKWDAKEAVMRSVKFRHQDIPYAKYEYLKEADITICIDISYSCAEQAEMFAAIAAGSVGNGVKVYIGYNGSVRMKELSTPTNRLKSYSHAKSWLASELANITGWENSHIDELDVDEFVRVNPPKLMIVFGDFDGLYEYERAVKIARQTKFIWFANEPAGKIPMGFNKKNYIPGIFKPHDFIRALKKI